MQANDINRLELPTARSWRKRWKQLLRSEKWTQVHTWWSEFMESFAAENIFLQIFVSCN